MANAFGIIDPSRIGALQPIDDGVAMVHGFANVGLAFGGGAVLIVDVCVPMVADAAVAALRKATNEPVSKIVYTHGHADHAGGARAFLADAELRGDPRPEIWAHALVKERFARYDRTWGWNNEVNRRQFAMPRGAEVFPKDFVPPDRTYDDRTTFDLAGETVELHHARAETDDATWVWLPERRVAMVGDLVVNSMPNTGNPNKTQRYTLGWADALDRIREKNPAHVLPGHGDPVSGDAAIELLANTSRALRHLHDAVVERLNDGRWPDEIVDEDLKLPPDLAALPYLAPIYGCAAFVVRDVLRHYAGWWGGDPAQLLPASRRVVAEDLLSLIDEDALIAKIRALRDEGAPKRALHLAMTLCHARPDDADARRLTAEVLEATAAEEPSYIARNFYAAAAHRLRSE